MFHVIHAAKASQYSSVSNYIAQFRPQKSKLRFFSFLNKFFHRSFYTMLLSHCCFQPLTQPYDPWLLLRTDRRTLFVLPHSKGSFLWTLQHYIWSNTTEVIDFLCLSVIPFVTRPPPLLSSLMVETPALKEIFRKTQRGDHFETSNFSCLHRCTFLQCVSGRGLHSKKLSARPSANRIL